MQEYEIIPSLGKLSRTWLSKQAEMALEDVDDMGIEVRRSVRQAYDNHTLVVPRNVCAFLYDLMKRWEEETPRQKEVFLYLTLVNAFPTNTNRFSHFSIIENLEQIYQYMVDRGYEDVPGVKAQSTSRERRQLMQKNVRLYIKTHPKEVCDLESKEGKSLLEERLEEPIW